uniref:IPT/TIG domain-containing protein n=1 Tax=Fagus sylvatica TaxID=28930 RepID=A0A2N9IUD1_FAGSY
MGNRTHFNRIKETEEVVPYSQEIESNSEIDSSVSSYPNNYQVTSQTTDTTSLNSAQASEYEDAESACNYQASSGFRPFFELQQQPMVEKINAGLTDPYFPASSIDNHQLTDDYQGKFSTILGVDLASLTQADKAKLSNDTGLKIHDFPLWGDALENGTSGNQAVTFQPSFPETKPDTIGVLPKQENPILGHHFTSNFGERQEIGSHPQVQKLWQTFEGKWHFDQNVHAESAYGVTSRFHEQDVNQVKLLNSQEPCLPQADKQDDDPIPNNLQVQLSDAEHEYYLKSDPEGNMALEGKTNSSFTLKKPWLDISQTEESLKKLDSFNRWMSKELGDVNESHMQSSSGAYWDSVESENRVDESNISPEEHLDNYTLGPSLSQDQLFSIIDFSPNWAYEGSTVKVLITGRFLKSQQEVENCKWSCMFGEVEVPAEVIADGVIRCHTPVHKAARIPFYVTCSNRLACSEVRDFEYRVNHIKDVNTTDNYSGNMNEVLLVRFKTLLSLTSACPPSIDSINVSEKSQVSSKISSLLEGDEDEWDQMLKLASEKDLSPEKLQEKLLEKLLKEKLHVWLLQKAAEGGKGPSVLEEGGQGVLHFAAALGYDWALEPTIIAGVSVNFRDMNGWTALHWAAFCGRERTVGSLVSLGAAPGALTDPSPKYPSGRTAADLASANGHKGIAGYLAESHLSTHLSSLKLDTGEGDAGEISGAKAVQTVAERSPTPISDGDLPYKLSLKDSLAAVCNASQAFARIHQVFRVESFHKKQLKEFGDDTFGMSDEKALSLLAVKTKKSGQHDLPVQAAAIRIQNKFRSWKGRREFLIIRQRIVKIQAHVRGHQVRKNYKKFVWSVGIVEKIILRWRRKGSGLRGFKSEALTEGRSKMQDTSSEDDYDFLKEGRKQTEERLQKALARVKSMAQYPDARDQYRRLLNVVTDIQGSKVVGDGVPNSSEEMSDFNDDLIDIEAFLDEDMPTA